MVVSPQMPLNVRIALCSIILFSVLLSFGSPAVSEGLSSMSPQDEHSTESPSTMENGRVRVCGGLVTSVNRSWQVAVEPGNRPAAPFKAMAPIASWQATKSTVEDQGDVYLAAVASHDAFWLGFEADEDLYFGVTIDFNGRNALNGRQGWSDALESEPQNFLLIPDQPWFDSIAGSNGTFEQLLPQVDPEVRPMSFASSGEIHLVIYPIEADALQTPLEQQPKGPVPLYSQEGASSQSQTNASIHPWRSRSLRSDFQTPHSCARLTFYIVEPKLYETLTGVQLPAGMFDDVGSTPPAPFNPFQAP